MTASRTRCYALAGSLLLLASACRDVTSPRTAALERVSGVLAAAKDKSAPTRPGNLRASNMTSTSASLTWDASTDNVGVTSYLVRNNFGGEISVAGSATGATWTGLQERGTYTFYVYALDASGNRSAASNFLSVTLPAPPAPNDPSDVTPPSAPTNVWADSYNDGSRELQVAWNASTDNVTPQSIIVYQVFVNGTLENSTDGKTQTSVYGVAGENVISVIAIDANGNRSAAATTSVTIPF